jgi:hypothetical protein
MEKKVTIRIEDYSPNINTLVAAITLMGERPAFRYIYLNDELYVLRKRSERSAFTLAKYKEAKTR